MSLNDLIKVQDLPKVKHLQFGKCRLPKALIVRHRDLNPQKECPGF